MPEIQERKTALGDIDNVKFVDLVIYAWACWTGRAVNLEPVSSGDLWGVVSTPEPGKYRLPLSDDQFLLVDLRYAQLGAHPKSVIEVRYFKGGYTDNQLKRLGLNRKEWDAKVMVA